MRKIFEIQTKIGPITFEVTGRNQLHAQTVRYSQHDAVPVVIRGKDEFGTITFVLDGDEWKGLTWKDSNNTMPMPADPNSWHIKGAAHMKDKWDGRKFHTASDAAHRTFYLEVSAALNTFWRTHTAEIDAERQARFVERTEQYYDSCLADVQEKQEALLKAQGELKKATADLIAADPALAHEKGLV